MHRAGKVVNTGPTGTAKRSMKLSAFFEGGNTAQGVQSQAALGKTTKWDVPAALITTRSIQGAVEETRSRKQAWTFGDTR